MGDGNLRYPPEYRYFLASNPKQPAPAVTPGNSLTPLINASAYFERLSQDIHRLGHGGQDEFIYIASFVLNWVQDGYPLMFPSDRGPVRLIDLLAEKARAGVDVRVLAWIPWNLALAGKIDLRPESRDNMNTILSLRAEPAIGSKACLNIIAHPAGSTHAKMVVLGSSEWAAGYTGGIDLAPDRAEPGWLDVQARVEGPAVQELYDFYRKMWNQNLAFSGLDPRTGRKGFLRVPRPVVFHGAAGQVACVQSDTPALPARTVAQNSTGGHRVQSLLTLPAFKFSLSPLLARIRVAPLEFAPGGSFQIRQAVQTAISQAEKYIYMEDQYFWSVEAMQWLNAAVRAHPHLHVILATGESDQLGSRLEAYRLAAVMKGLLPGLDQAQQERITFVKRKELLHAKTILIDDRWGLIGSCNIARRSMYMDIEHALAFDDPGGSLVRDYRLMLWASRLGLTKPRSEKLSDMNFAFSLWGFGKERMEALLNLPFRPAFENLTTAPVFDREWYEMVEDPDSRKPWYFPIRRSYNQFMP